MGKSYNLLYLKKSTNNIKLSITNATKSLMLLRGRFQRTTCERVPYVTVFVGAVSVDAQTLENIESHLI